MASVDISCRSGSDALTLESETPVLKYTGIFRTTRFALLSCSMCVCVCADTEYSVVQQHRNTLFVLLLPAIEVLNTYS
jgi:hypothetical protein